MVTREELFRRCRIDAVRLATALTGRREVGEDLAQDVLLRVADRLEAGVEVDDVDAYVRRSVVNACRMWHRANGREQRRLLRVTADASHESPAADDGVADRLDAEAMQTLASLAVLGYRQRASIVLRYWGQWSDAEIAAALGCRVPTVRTLVHRGLARLREELLP